MVNQTSTYRPLTGDVTGSRTLPPTSVASATVARPASVALLPTRTWTSAPSGLPRTSRRLLGFTAPPMSRSRPVPDCRLPSSGDAYQEVYHGWAPALLTRETMSGLSPSAGPPGPNAAIDATRSGRGAGLGVTTAMAGGAAEAGAASPAGACDAAGAADARALPAVPTWPETETETRS